MVKKKSLLILMALFISAILIFFFIQKDKKQNASSAKKSLTILLDWYISEDQAPLLLAKINGNFEKYDLEVNLVELSDPSQAPKLLIAHQADMAISYGGSYFEELKAKLPIKQVGTVIDHPLNCLIYLAQSGIHSPKDLKNKKVGYSDANDDFSLLKAVLKAGGLSMNDVVLVNIQNTLMQSLMLGKIDIAADMMRNIQPVVMEHHGFSPSMFCPEEVGIPNYSELIYIALEKTEDKEFIDFFKALKEATEAMNQQPEKAWDQLKTNYPKFNTDIHHEIWKKTYPLFAKEPEKK